MTDFIPDRTLSALHDIGLERLRQLERWGNPDHPDVPANVPHPNAYFGLPTEAAAKLMCEDAFRRGLGSHGHVLLEEVAEAYAAIGNDTALRAELVQVAAVATAWIEAIDRRRFAEPVREVRHG